MKNLFFFCLMVGLFFSNNAFCGDYLFSNWWSSNSTGTKEATAWGSPYIDTTFIQDATRDSKKFRIKEGWACCGDTPQVIENGPYCKDNGNKQPCKDDQSMMVFIAREIFEHGGHFCLTQLSATSSDTHIGIYHQQPNWPGMPCMTLCEPGWYGPGCGTELESDKKGKAGLDIPCDATDITANIERVQQNKYDEGFFDALSLHYARMGVADDTEYFNRVKIGSIPDYEHVVYLGATDFVQHGITAQPMLVAAVGNHPSVTWLTSAPANSGKVKTLCAQGYTRNERCEMNSGNCGSTAWCSGYSDAIFDKNKAKYEKVMNVYCNVIRCKDGATALDDDFNCKPYDGYQNGRCDALGNGLYGRLVKCSEGTIFNSKNCECDEAVSYTKEVMRLGPKGEKTENVELVTDQCWTKENTDDFKECIGVKKPISSSSAALKAKKNLPE